MNKINILSEQVINKIAAGEVIERPSSIVKELVENSIDAKSDRIEVHFEGNGTPLIKIIDNGIGMSSDDALLCLKRHATSKIKDLTDIEHINSMGFRGEAVASIAAVSKLDMVTAPKVGASEGTHIVVVGGKITSHKAIGAPFGTKFTIRNLFFNTPARLKFLNSIQSEAKQIVTQLKLIALAHPHIYFKLVQDGRTVIESPATDNLQERLRVVFGKNSAEEFIPFSFAADFFKLSGFLTKPSFTRSNRAYQYTFVNSRPVYNQNILFGLNKGYQDMIPKGRFPAAVLFIEVNPQMVDVNIHPTKREVKIAKQNVIVSSLIHVVTKTLAQKTAASFLASEAINEDVLPAYKERNFQVKESSSINKYTAFEEPIVRRFADSQSVEQTPEVTQRNLLSTTAEDNIKVIGQLHNSYILAESLNGMWIIDQHAAHERLLYEKVKEEFYLDKIASQKLLFPETVELMPDEVKIISDNIAIFDKLGFEVRPFGEESIIVEAVAVFIKNAPVSDIITGIMNEIDTDVNTAINTEEFAEKIMRYCCRRSVMAADKMSIAEMQKLMDDVFAHNIPLSCPHGRPIATEIFLSDIEKKFKR